MNGYANSKLALNNGNSRTDNPMEDKRTLTTELLAYLTGIFEGEGYIHVNKTSSPHSLKLWKRKTPNFALNCGVTNSHRGVLELFQEAFGGSIYDRTSHQVYDYRIDRKLASVMLRSFLPYMVIKKEQAIIAVEFQASLFLTGKTVEKEKLEYRDFVYRKIKSLNGSYYHQQRLSEPTPKNGETIVRHSRELENNKN